MTFRVIPNANFGGGSNATGLVPRSTLEKTAPAVEQMRLTACARMQPEPVIYGRDRVGGLISAVVVDAAGNLLLRVILSRGVIDAVESVEFDDKPAPAGVTRVDYLGTALQAADPWLVAAFAARGSVYADTLPNIAYSVLKVPQGPQYGFTRLNFIVRGRKVQEPRISGADATFRAAFADAGSGLASVALAAGSGAVSVTRSGVATTIMENGLLTSALAVDTPRSYWGEVFYGEKVAHLRRTGDYLSTPDSVANSITGDISIVFDSALIDYTPPANMALVTKWGGAGSRSISFYVTTSGALGFAVSFDGTATSVNAISTVTSGVTNGSRILFRVDRIAATGSVLFYTSPDGVTWTQLGTTVAAAAGSIFNTSNDLFIGRDGTGFYAYGKLYGVRLYNGAYGGTPVVVFDPNDHVGGATTVVSSATGETWTLQGYAFIRGEQRRHDYLGLLVEASRSNVYTRTNDLNNASSWSVVSATRTNDAYAGPDGALADLVNYNGTVATWDIIYQGLFAANTYCWSGWGASNDGSLRTAYVSWFSPVANQHRPVFLDGTLRRHTPDSFATANNVNVQFGNHNTVTPAAPPWGAFSAQWACMQLEVGTFATTYIPRTTAAATRGEELVTCPVAGNLPATNYVLFFTWTPLASAAAMTAVVLWASYFDADNYLNISTSGTTLKAVRRVAGVTTEATKTFDFKAGVSYGIAMRVSATQGLSIFTNGAKGTDSAVTTAPVLGTVFQLGGWQGGSTGTACFKDMYLLPWDLTDAEVATIYAGGVIASGAHSNRLYSDNAVLAYADFIVDPVHGRAEAIDWDSVAACADVADELVGGLKRRTLGMTIGQRQPVDVWDGTLRALAGVDKVYEGDTAKLIADAPASPAYDFYGRTDGAEASNIVLDSIRMVRRDPSQAPTAFRVGYTDTTVTPWAKNTQECVLPDVDIGLGGTLPYIDSNIELPGCTDPGMAVREAIRRGKASELCDTNIAFVATDEALTLHQGDVVTVTDLNYGLVAKAFRLTDDPAPVELGRFQINAIEYQAGVYSDATATDVVIPDTGLPSAAVCLPPAGIVVVEELYLDQTQGSTLAGGAKYLSRLRATLTASPDGFLRDYYFEVLDGASIIGAAPSASGVFTSPAVQQGKLYTVRGYAVNAVGVKSTPVTATVTALGKLLPPSDVPAIEQAFEIGGEVLFSIQPAADIDTLRYEWRYTPNSTSGTWEAAVLIDRVDGLRARFRGLPVGTHRFYVKALDTVPQYSANAAYADVTVTSDADAFLQAREFTSPTLTQMVKFKNEGEAKPRWITNNPDTWSTLFPSAMTTYTDPVATYGTGTSKWVGESWDLGGLFAGDWSLAVAYTDHEGTATVDFETSDDGMAWTLQSGTSWTGAARFVRPVIETTGTVEIHAPPSMSFSGVTRRESNPPNAPVTSLSSGPTTVNLAQKYALLVAAPNITVLGSTPLIATVDNVVLSPSTTNSFDVYLFDDGGIQVAADFTWEIEGYQLP